MDTTTAPAAPTTDAPLTALLGNGKAIHLTDGGTGVLCNRWGSVNGVWKPANILGGPAELATCKRCQKLMSHPGRP